jgi:hypothetical protein
MTQTLLRASPLSASLLTRPLWGDIRWHGDQPRYVLPADARERNPALGFSAFWRVDAPPHFVETVYNNPVVGYLSTAYSKELSEVERLQQKVERIFAKPSSHAITGRDLCDLAEAHYLLGELKDKIPDALAYVFVNPRLAFRKNMPRLHKRLEKWLSHAFYDANVPRYMTRGCFRTIRQLPEEVLLEVIFLMRYMESRQGTAMLFALMEGELVDSAEFVFIVKSLFKHASRIDCIRNLLKCYLRAERKTGRRNGIRFELDVLHALYKIPFVDIKRMGAFYSGIDVDFHVTLDDQDYYIEVKTHLSRGNLRQLEELSELAGRRGTKLLVVVKGYNEWDGMAADLERLNIELILYNKLESGLREIVTKQRYVA